MSKRLFYAITALLLMVALLVPSAKTQAQNSPAPNVVITATFQVVVGLDLSTLIPPTTAVDVLLDGTKVTSSLSFNASGFVIVPNGTIPHTITLVKTGSSTVVGTPLANITFGGGTDWSLILLPNQTWGSSIADIDTKPAEGQVTARVINLSQNGPVDVTVNSVPSTTFLGTAINSASGYQSFAIGTHSATLTGSALSDNHNFLPAHVYSIFVFGTTAPTKVLVSTEFDFSDKLYMPVVSR